MLKKLLGTTALVAIASTVAIAQDKQIEWSDDAFLVTIARDHWTASELIGLPVESSSGENTETIGDIENLIVGADGMVDAAVIGVGGFLGVGEKDIAVSWDRLGFKTNVDGERMFVLPASRDILEQAPAFVGVETTSMADSDKSSDKAETGERLAARDGTATEDSSNRLGDPPSAFPERETLKVIEISDIRAEHLLNMRVRTYENEDVGEVGDLIIGDDGAIDALIVDFGGFLGIGEKEVSVGFEAIEFRGDEQGRVYLFTDLTKEQMEQAPEFEKASYKERRDEMRIVGD